jgi:hypothetical protein
MKKNFIILSFIFLHAFAFAQKNKTLENTKSKETFDKINKIDTNGMKQGLWLEYKFHHSNNGFPLENSFRYLFALGYYFNDNKSDKWIYYSHLGLMIKLEEYINDSTYLETQFYDSNQIKSNGIIEIQKTNNFDTIAVQNPYSGLQLLEVIRIYNYTKKGDWQYYHKDGTLARKEKIELKKEE